MITLQDSKSTACLMMVAEHLYYFGGYDSRVSVNSPQALIFTAADDRSTLLLRNADLPLAEESSWVSEILATKALPQGGLQ
jgi:Xaa-Pro aminopeptidase